MADVNWWDERRAEAEKTKGTQECVAVKEEMANEFYSEKKYKEAAEMYEQAAISAAQFPDMVKYADKYFDRAASMRKKHEKFESSKAGGYFSKLLVFMSVLMAFLGVTFLTPNFTGRAIFESGTDVTNGFGIIFLATALILAAWYILRR